MDANPITPMLLDADGADEDRAAPLDGHLKILGMCEILDDKGGREDTFALARDLHMPFPRCCW